MVDKLCRGVEEDNVMSRYLDESCQGMEGYMWSGRDEKFGVLACADGYLESTDMDGLDSFDTDQISVGTGRRHSLTGSYRDDNVNDVSDDFSVVNLDGEDDSDGESILDDDEGQDDAEEEGSYSSDSDDDDEDGELSEAESESASMCTNAVPLVKVNSLISLTQATAMSVDRRKNSITNEEFSHPMASGTKITGIEATVDSHPVPSAKTLSDSQDNAAPVVDVSGPRAIHNLERVVAAGRDFTDKKALLLAHKKNVENANDISTGSTAATECDDLTEAGEEFRGSSSILLLHEEETSEIDTTHEEGEEVERRPVKESTGPIRKGIARVPDVVQKKTDTKRHRHPLELWSNRLYGKNTGKERSMPSRTDFDSLKSSLASSSTLSSDRTDVRRLVSAVKTKDALLPVGREGIYREIGFEVVAADAVNPSNALELQGAEKTVNEEPTEEEIGHCNHVRDSMTHQSKIEKGFTKLFRGPVSAAKRAENTKQEISTKTRKGHQFATQLTWKKKSTKAKIVSKLLGIPRAHTSPQQNDKNVTKFVKSGLPPTNDEKENGETNILESGRKEIDGIRATMRGYGVGEDGSEGLESMFEIAFVAPRGHPPCDAGKEQLTTKETAENQHRIKARSKISKGTSGIADVKQRSHEKLDAPLNDDANSTSAVETDSLPANVSASVADEQNQDTNLSHMKRTSLAIDLHERSKTVDTEEDDDVLGTDGGADLTIVQPKNTHTKAATYWLAPNFAQEDVSSDEAGFEVLDPLVLL